MNATPYLQVLQNAVELTGRVYDDGEGNVVLLAEEAVTFRSLIGRAIRHAWTEVPWPETTLTEPRWFADTYDPATVYAALAMVYFPATDAYYQALVASTGQAPETLVDEEYVVNAGYWAELTDSYETEDWDAATVYSVGDAVLYALDGYTYYLHTAAPAGTIPTSVAYWCAVEPIERLVELDQDWETNEMHDVVSVYLDDPRRYPRPTEAAFVQDTTGIRILDAVTGVYVRFFTTPTSFVTDPTEIPGRFADYAALSAAGWQLRMDGKKDAGSELLLLAEQELQTKMGTVNWGDQAISRIAMRR